MLFVIDVLSNTPPQVIVNLFGHGVWASLQLLSKYLPVFDPVTGQTTARYKKSTEVYFAELSSASVEDRLVKLADRHHNMCSMVAWEYARQLKYALETRDHILPIALATDPWFSNELSALTQKYLDKK